VARSVFFVDPARHGRQCGEETSSRVSRSGYHRAKHVMDAMETALYHTVTPILFRSVSYTDKMGEEDKV
jgi:hypothetical protein